MRETVIERVIVYKKKKSQKYFNSRSSALTFPYVQHVWLDGSSRD